MFEITDILQNSPGVQQQYWDWPKYQDSPQTSPVFYGPYSLGNNGDYIEHNGTVITPPEGVSGGDIQLPAGVGGGYVTTGYVLKPLERERERLSFSLSPPPSPSPRCE